MYPVSYKWAEAADEILAPEGLIEISCYIPELRETLVYTKKDLLSFTHQQTGSLVSGELPKNHIEFSLDNSDGMWNPSNPRGLERYLSERLRITLRYGFVINGVEKWIPGGIFYLSEWRTPTNGLEASFVARDIFEYMIDRSYTGPMEGTLYDIVQNVLAEAGISTSDAILGEIVLGEAALPAVDISKRLKKYSVGEIKYEGTERMAAILQKCANAAGCAIYQGRDGQLIVKPISYTDSGFVVSQHLSYSHPKIEFSRPIKNVLVTYYGNAVEEYKFSDSGETQTMNNNLIKTKKQASEMARWVCNSLLTRRQISVEFRGDPRFDLFDVVGVESKYGMITGVVLTDIKCVFTGAFYVTCSGYVRGTGSAGVAYSGEIYTGEVM